jgi:acyl dehydratase
MINIPEVDALVGTELGVSEWFMITQDMVNRFAKLTRDEQWIHTDEERARKFMPKTGTIVHGFFTVSMLSHLQHQAIKLPDAMRNRIKSIINYGLDGVRFISPVPVGSRIRARVELADAVNTDKGAQLTFKTTIEIEGHERPAMVSNNIALYILG